MPTPTSEYHIPIFVSSTDYNLKDLRKELSRYLSELGYQPILSSEEGFHDSSPTKEPWESCLEVLSTCPIMILIIDNRYGAKFPWKNYSKIISKDVSPTHGEYIFAHSQQKRLLVFIRKEIYVYYQSYKQVKKDLGDNEDEIKNRMVSVLPKNSHIEYEVFPFIEEVKTSKPIPWIKEFEDVTDLKREVHKKLLNELAVVFLIKERQTEVVTAALSKILDESSEGKRRDILESMGITKELMEKYEREREKVSDLSIQMEKLEIQAADYESQIVTARTAAQKDDKKIKDLEVKLSEVEAQRQVNKETVSWLRGKSRSIFSGSSIYNFDDKWLKLQKYDPYTDQLSDDLISNITAKLAIPPKRPFDKPQDDGLAPNHEEEKQPPILKKPSTAKTIKKNVEDDEAKLDK